MPINIRVNFSIAQAAYNPNATGLRVSLSHVQATLYQTPPPNVRVNVTYAESVGYQEELPKLHVPFMFCQYIQRGPIETMSTEVYPELIGLSYTTTAKPTYSNDIQTHTSGKETRVQYWENAKWDFSLQYDYLPNKSPSFQTDFKKLVGFFLSRTGSFDTFLFKAPDDNFVELVTVGTGDGNTTEYPLFRPMGTFLEPIGQVDTANATVYVESQAEHYTIPVAPYEITLIHPQVVALLGVTDGTNVYTQVNANPGNHQFTYDPLTAKLTFWVGNEGANISVHYKWIGVAGTDFSYLMPRTLVFHTTPSIGDVITASFGFYFIVRFMEDVMELDQFMDKLWELGKIEFRSQV